MNTKVWLIRFTDGTGTAQAVALGANAIGDYRQIDPNATVEELDVLALADLLAADRVFDKVVADVQAHSRESAEFGYTRLGMTVTRELCERYVHAELDRADAIERCSGVAA